MLLRIRTTSPTEPNAATDAISCAAAAAAPSSFPSLAVAKSKSSNDMESNICANVENEGRRGWTGVGGERENEEGLEEANIYIHIQRGKCTCAATCIYIIAR